MNKETIDGLVKAGRHGDACRAIEEYLKEHGKDESMHRLLLSEKQKLADFYREAAPFEYEPEPTKDPRAILYHRWLSGEKVLLPLIQAHLMVPKDKTVVPEVIRLVSQLPKSLDGLYVLAIAMGDRADDYERAAKLGEKFLRICPKTEKVYPLMEKMVDYWHQTKTDPSTFAYRLGHGDAMAMVEAANAADDKWLSELWLMHGAANGSLEARKRLANRAMERGQTELAIRLSRPLEDRQEFLIPELEILVYRLHDYNAAEQLAWMLDSDEQSNWLRIIHYAQGKTKDTVGIEHLVKRLEESVLNDNVQ